MITTSLFLLTLIIIIALIWGKPVLTSFRHQRLFNQPFPSFWVTILNQYSPVYQRLPASLRKQLHGHINVFLAEKKFQGCGGLQITEVIKLTIAAQACLLLLNKSGGYYSKLYSILVYPNAFITNKNIPFGDYYLEEKQVQAGESWRIGIVVLSWAHIMHDLSNWQDGRNVVFHEFAHQLDQENGSANGVPRLGKKSDYITWSHVFSKEYERLQNDIAHGLETVIDEYGATNPAEFFAVATETFFEKPELMKLKHPELYHQLQHYYKLDPIKWMEARD